MTSILLGLLLLQFYFNVLISTLITIVNTLLRGLATHPSPQIPSLTYTQSPYATSSPTFSFPHSFFCWQHTPHPSLTCFLVFLCPTVEFWLLSCAVKFAAAVATAATPHPRRRCSRRGTIPHRMLPHPLPTPLE